MTDRKAQTLTSKQRLKELSQLLSADGVEDYVAASKRLHAANQLFRELLAEQLIEPLNRYLRDSDHGTAVQKQLLARNVNADCRSLGLAIRCPRTSEPAFLRGARGSTPGKSAFQICLLKERGHACTRTFAEPIYLELMPRREREDPEIEIQGR